MSVVVPPRRRLILILLVLAVAGWWVWRHVSAPAPVRTLYGNVEIREVDLAFNSEGTLTELTKREGDRVRAGELLAVIDPATYEDAERAAEANRDQAKAALDKLLNGTRPEDIDQDRANLAVAKAALADAQLVFDRQHALVLSHTEPQQSEDDARKALDTARGQVAQTQAALTEALAGPRIEDIDAARAAFRQSEALLRLAQTQLERTRLFAPSDGIVMTRVVEPGTVVTPATVVYAVALTSETWIRAFVPESLLSRVAPGTMVTLSTDGQPGKLYHGTVGYVSPQAEFTPKTVETPELRTQLVYRVRVRVNDPDSGLRQGQPVTLHLAP